jgi:MFS family permease
MMLTCRRVLLGMMFSCLDMSIVSTALVKISVDLDNDYLDAPWVILAYLLTYMGKCLSQTGF